MSLFSNTIVTKTVACTLIDYFATFPNSLFLSVFVRIFFYYIISCHLWIKIIFLPILQHKCNLFTISDPVHCHDRSFSILNVFNSKRGFPDFSSSDLCIHLSMCVTLTLFVFKTEILKSLGTFSLLYFVQCFYCERFFWLVFA